MTYTESYKLYGMLIRAYEWEIGELPEELLSKLSDDMYYIKELAPLLSDFKYDDLDIMTSNWHLMNKIVSRRGKDYLFDRPIVFLFYYVMLRNHNVFRHFAPLTPDQLEPFYVDLGISQRD